MKEGQERILRKKEVMRMVGLSDVSLWRRERDGTFPRRLKLGGGGRSVGWIYSEVREWIHARAAERLKK